MARPTRSVKPNILPSLRQLITELNWTIVIPTVHASLSTTVAGWGQPQLATDLLRKQLMRWSVLSMPARLSSPKSLTCAYLRGLQRHVPSLEHDACQMQHGW